MIKINLECSIDNIGYLVHMEHDEVNAELEELLEEELPWTHYDHVKNEKKSGNIPPICRVGRAAASPESEKIE